MAYSHLINFLFSRLEESEDSAPKETQGLVFSNLIVSRRINHNNLATENSYFAKLSFAFILSANKLQ